MAPLADLRQQLYDEMLSHVKQTDVSVPYRDRGWWYLVRTEEGLQYPVYCRKADTPGAEEQVILDGNALAEGQNFMSIGSMAVTDDGLWLAYTIDHTGFRQYTLHIKNLATGEVIDGTVERVGSIVWAADNTTLFYTVEDEEQKRQYQLWRHALGTAHTTDTLVLEETDERFNLGAGRTPRWPVAHHRIGQPHYL